MNKVHIFLTVFAVIIAAIGCGGGKKADGTMTMTTSAERVSFWLHGSGAATVDWGDGSEAETLEFLEGEEGNLFIPFSRQFSDINQRTITITGENITGLNCQNNQLTALDVSRNIILSRLQCFNNLLTELDVSQNVALKHLNCRYNQLAELNIGKNTVLELLDCSENKLTALDVSRNVALEILDCSGNQLTTLDVSRNISLTELVCGRNQLTTIDVSRNAALSKLLCNRNPVTVLNIGRNAVLEELHCAFNQLTALDVSGAVGLVLLDCSNNHITRLDVSHNIAMRNLLVGNNQFTASTLNDLFGALHNNVITWESEYDGSPVTYKYVYIYENPGSADCDPAIAQAKGWTVEGFEGAQNRQIHTDEFARWFEMEKDAIIEYLEESYEIVYYTEDLLEGYFFVNLGMTFMFDGDKVEWIIPPLEHFGLNENMNFEQIETIYGTGERNSYFMEQAGGNIYTLTYEADNHTVEFTSVSANGANPTIRCYRKIIEN